MQGKKKTPVLRLIAVEIAMGYPAKKILPEAKDQPSTQTMREEHPQSDISLPYPWPMEKLLQV